MTISREGEIALNKELEKGTSYSLLGFKFEFEFLNGWCPCGVKASQWLGLCQLLSLCICISRDSTEKRVENTWKKKFCDIPEKNRTWICHSSSTVYTALTLYLGFPGGSDSKESVCNAGDTDLIPGLGRSPGVGNGNPLQYSCLENSMDREAWRATVHGVAKSRTRLSDFLYSATSPWGALIPLFLT